MKIGIDIDGVLNNMHDFIIDYGTKLCNDLGNYKVEEINAKWSTGIFLWSNDVAHELWNKYGKELYVKAPAKKFASEVIKKLKEYNNEIYIITARKKNDEWFPIELREKTEEITIKWLEENEIIYDKICFDSKDKVKICKELGIDIMIEDDPENIDVLIETTNVFIFDTPYNRLEKYKDVKRVYSWYDIYSVLQVLVYNEVKQ